MKVANRITLSDITMDEIFSKSCDNHNRGKNQDRQKQSERSRNPLKTTECNYCHVIFTGRGNKKYCNEMCKYTARIQDPVFCQKERERSKESYSRRSQDPVYRQKQREYAKEYYRRWRSQDPVYRKKRENMQKYTEKRWASNISKVNENGTIG